MSQKTCFERWERERILHRFAPVTVVLLSYSHFLRPSALLHIISFLLLSRPGPSLFSSADFSKGGMMMVEGGDLDREKKSVWCETAAVLLNGYTSPPCFFGFAPIYGVEGRVRTSRCVYMTRRHRPCSLPVTSLGTTSRGREPFCNLRKASLLLLQRSVYERGHYCFIYVLSITFSLTFFFLIYRYKQIW